MREFKWGLPEGLQVAAKPAKLDDALMGMIIVMRWAAPYGWEVGRIANTIKPSTPHGSSKTSTFAAHGPTGGPTTC